MKKVQVPPIKSQGIKTKLVGWIGDTIGEVGGKWVEPFMGTGVVGFNLASTQGVFNDANPHLVKFYQEVQSGRITGQVVRDYLEREGEILRQSEEDGYVHFREVRDRFNDSPNSLDFLFLSRTGFNGMMRFNKKGRWNIPFCKKPNRFSQAYITKIVNQVDGVASLIQKEWEFISGDFEKILSGLSKDDVVYCDPPYHGRHVDYFNTWSLDDEERLARLIQSLDCRFVLSTWSHNAYRKNDSIPAFWSDYNIHLKEHYYHAGGKIQNRGGMMEALITNF